MAFLTEKYRKKLESAKAIQHGDFAIIADQTGYGRRHIREVIRKGANTSDEAIKIITDYYDNRLELMYKQTKVGRKFSKLARELDLLAKEMKQPLRAVTTNTTASIKN